MEPLYTAEALSVGDARNGQAYLADRSIDLKMSVPKEMGGAGDGANPEQLFALGYAACFHSALKLVARVRPRQTPPIPPWALAFPSVPTITAGSSSPSFLKFPSRTSLWIRRRNLRMRHTRYAPTLTQPAATLTCRSRSSTTNDIVPAGRIAAKGSFVHMKEPFFRGKTGSSGLKPG